MYRKMGRAEGRNKFSESPWAIEGGIAMKILGIIPARYNSSRFPGKVLALLGDKPLFWHVYNAALLSGVLDEVCVAADHVIIQDTCRKYGISCVMTGNEHQNPTSRIQEAAGQAEADLYVMLGADEPLISPGDIRLVVGKAVSSMLGTPDIQSSDKPFVVNAMTSVFSAPEVFDSANIKIVCSDRGLGLYASRSPIPYPKGSLSYCYKKFVSIGVYTKEALDFFSASPKGRLEQIEEFDLLRFMEQNKAVLFVEIPGTVLSVDTPKDLERVRETFADRAGEMVRPVKPSPPLVKESDTNEYGTR